MKVSTTSTATSTMALEGATQYVTMALQNWNVQRKELKKAQQALKRAKKELKQKKEASDTAQYKLHHAIQFCQNLTEHHARAMATTTHNDGDTTATSPASGFRSRGKQQEQEEEDDINERIFLEQQLQQQTELMIQALSDAMSAVKVFDIEDDDDNDDNDDNNPDDDKTGSGDGNKNKNKNENNPFSDDYQEPQQKICSEHSDDKTNTVGNTEKEEKKGSCRRMKQPGHHQSSNSKGGVNDDDIAGLQGPAAIVANNKNVDPKIVGGKMTIQNFNKQQHQQANVNNNITTTTSKPKPPPKGSATTTTTTTQWYAKLLNYHPPDHNDPKQHYLK